MSINPILYTHPSDQAALQALQAIPGFTPLLKAFMNSWSERLYRIENMATNLRISEKQLPKYYQMLPPICEKLGIEVPELYLAHDIEPDIYTYGEEKPFIVITSELAKNLPEELIPTVLARECGHIACHHVLYSTMGRLILNGSINLLGLGDLVSFPLKSAFYYWMRCSEFSADRAAAICDGTSDNILKLCAFFAGYHKRLDEELNVEAFLEQAEEYKALVDESKVNKSLAFLMFSDNAHPINVLRAYECNQWQKEDSFCRMLQYLEGNQSHLPLPQSTKYYIGMSCKDAREHLEGVGFSNFRLVRSQYRSHNVTLGHVVDITVDAQPLVQSNWVARDACIDISYYEPPTQQEISSAHPGQAQIPRNSVQYMGMPYQKAVEELEAAGFCSITCQGQKSPLAGLLLKSGSITQISIGGRNFFEKGLWLACDAPVKITYHI